MTMRNGKIRLVELGILTAMLELKDNGKSKGKNIYQLKLRLLSDYLKFQLKNPSIPMILV